MSDHATNLGSETKSQNLLIIIVILEDVPNSPDGRRVDILVSSRLEIMEAVRRHGVGVISASHVHCHAQVYPQSSANIIKESAVLC